MLHILVQYPYSPLPTREPALANLTVYIDNCGASIATWAISATE